MTPKQFEQYRKQQEMLRKLQKPAKKVKIDRGIKPKMPEKQRPCETRPLSV